MPRAMSAHSAFAARSAAASALRAPPVQRPPAELVLPLARAEGELAAAGRLRLRPRRQKSEPSKLPRHQSSSAWPSSRSSSFGESLFSVLESTPIGSQWPFRPAPSWVGVSSCGTAFACGRVTRRGLRPRLRSCYSARPSAPPAVVLLGAAFAPPAVVLLGAAFGPACGPQTSRRGTKARCGQARHLACSTLAPTALVLRGGATSRRLRSTMRRIFTEGRDEGSEGTKEDVLHDRCGDTADVLRHDGGGAKRPTRRRARAERAPRRATIFRPCAEQRAHHDRRLDPRAAVHRIDRGGGRKPPQFR